MTDKPGVQPAGSLIIGYGNPDRQDDGLAWHVLCGLAQHLGRPLPDVQTGFNPGGQPPDLWFVLQLTPEMAEEMAHYRQVIFVDAHVGAASSEAVRTQRLEAQFQSSPLTHHLTPESCLELAAQVYHARPAAWLVSILGDAFGFSDQLSSGAQARVAEAVRKIVSLVDTEKAE